MQLTSVNMNLLVVLGALLDTGRVRVAAERLSLSPSATSHALSRLRELFDDELLVRAGSGMVATPRAEAIRPRLRRLLEDAEAVLSQEEELAPHELRRSFRIASTDYAELLVLRALSDAVAEEAPGVSLHAAAVPEGLVEGLRAGRVDLGIGVMRNPPPDVHMQTLFTEQFVCLLRKGHPALRRKLSIERYAALDHVLVSPGGTPRGIVDEVLAEHGLQRRVARSVSSFLVAPRMVAETDYVLTIARRVACLLAEPLGLVMRKPPVELPGYALSMMWHRAQDADPAHVWLRERALSVADR